MSFKVDTAPIRAHKRAEIIAAQFPPEGHALFNNMLASIKEQSHGIFVFFCTTELWGGGWLTSVVMDTVADGR